MGRVTLKLPRLGETMEEARIVEWMVAPGEAYARGDILLEVETDKTVVEVPALKAGTLVARLAEAGETVDLDRPVAEVDEEEGPDAPASVPAAPSDAPPVADRMPAPPSPTTSPAPPSGRVAASPAARAAARRKGVALEALVGTGRRGRVTAADVGTGGSGAATIVLLHGLHDDAGAWAGLISRLAARGLAAVALDLPGHGADDAVPTGFEDAVDRLAARLPDGPLHLAGHSLGAAMAARLAARVDARALTLFAPAGIGARIDAGFLDGMAAAVTVSALARALERMGAGPMSESALRSRLETLVATRDCRAALARAMARDGMQQIDVRADIAAAPCPVAVVFGTGDRILDWRDVAGLPAETRLHLVPGAGHLPHLASPDLAATLVARAVGAGKNA